MDAADVLTVREAAGCLGISERGVTQLAASGVLKAAKRANVWWVDADAVARRFREQPVSGRPLSPTMTWSVLMLASDLPCWRELATDAHQASRTRRWLEEHPLADNAFRLKRRARRETFVAHPSEIARVGGRNDVMPTGISAAREVGLSGGDAEAELYAAESRRDAIVTEHALEPGAGPVVVRWVPDDLWPRVGTAVAPRAAVLVDLLEHDDPRARREARRSLAR